MADMVDMSSLHATFSQLGLNDWIVNQCSLLGILKPSPVQYHCIPPILNGQDCIGCSKTGSGKTAAFALPILQKLSEDPYGIFAVVITPTRELAYQIAEQFRVFGKPIGLRDCVIVGGMSMIDQAAQLTRKPHVLIATPGRLVDHLKSCNTFSLKEVKFLVIDEADRLLEIENGFTEELEVIFNALPAKRQTLLFSATVTDTIEELKKVATNSPFFWEYKNEVATVAELEQHYILVPAMVKDVYLVYLVQDFMNQNKNATVMIFTKTCRCCHILAEVMKKMKIKCAELHSRMDQRDRINSLESFKSKRVRVLVSTDLSSRGLDVPAVELVINHNVPQIAKNYIHRVGRTARAGRSGKAITLVTQFDLNLLRAVEEAINTKLTEYTVDEKEVLAILNVVTSTKTKTEVNMDEKGFDDKKKKNKRIKMILEGKDPEIEEKKRSKKLKQLRKERRQASRI